MATGLRRSKASEPEFDTLNDPLSARLDISSASLLSAFIPKAPIILLQPMGITVNGPLIRTIILIRRQIGILYQTINDFDLAACGPATKCLQAMGSPERSRLATRSCGAVRWGAAAGDCWTLPLVFSIIAIELRASMHTGARKYLQMGRMNWKAQFITSSRSSNG